MCLDLSVDTSLYDAGSVVIPVGLLSSRMEPAESFLWYVSKIEGAVPVLDAVPCGG